MVSPEEGIAIAEICVYIPIFTLTLVIVLRHCFKRQAGWIILLYSVLFNSLVQASRLPKYTTQ
jgi:hypothetical protein